MKVPSQLAVAAATLLLVVSLAAPAAAPDKVLVCHLPNHVGDRVIGDRGECEGGRVLRIPATAVSLHQSTDPGGNECDPTAVPSSSGAAILLQDVRGDSGRDSRTRSSTLCRFDEDWYRFRLTEDDPGFVPNDLTARIRMTAGRLRPVRVRRHRVDPEPPLFDRWRVLHDGAGQHRGGRRHRSG